MANCLWHDQEEYASWNHTQYENHGGYGIPWPSPGEASAMPLPFETSIDSGAGDASRSHSESEKRRRDRINSHLSTLRKLIPKSEKMDKAALLGQVVEQVKELKEKAKESRNISTIPSEIDEVSIDLFNEKILQNSEKIYLRASISCDDRPELFAELSAALKMLGVTIVQADLTSLGGRVKNIFVLCAEGKCVEQNIYASSLKQSVRLVLSRVAMSSSTSSQCSRSKRQRFFFHNSH